MSRADIVVIGAGVAGTAAARALARDGRSVVLLEQFSIGHDRGSSHGPTRIFRLAYPEVDYIGLAQRALVEWRRLEDEAGEELLVPVGALHAGAWGTQCRETLETCAVEHEWLSVAAACERFPMMRFDGLDGVLWEPSGAVCLADRVVAAQARLAREAGAEVREGERVLAIAREGAGVRVETDAGELRAAVAVVTAGPYAAPLLASLGVSLPLRPAFAQVSYYAPAGDGAEAPPVLIEGDPADGGGISSGGYWLPTPGTLEVKAAEGSAGRTIDPADAPLPVDADLLARDAAWVSRRLRGYGPEPTRVDTCIYTMTPDEDFVLDRIGPVVVGSACSGHGFKFGPLLGELIAGLAIGEAPGMPRRRFALSRFS